MKYLVFGANGQLGAALQSAGKTGNIHIVGLDIADCDITRSEALERKIDAIQPSVIINAAAYTQVDKAETEPEQAFAVNRDAVKLMAAKCRQLKIPLIHVSTDYVFNGQQTTPYLETDQTDPQGIYGISKAQGEAAAAEILPELIIVRTSWLYGKTPPNFVFTILKLAAEREQLSIVSDQYGTPTSADDLAAALLNIAAAVHSRNSIKWGIYHYSGKGVTTWFDFAQAIINSAKQYIPLTVNNILPISTAEYPTPAKRPPYSVLDCQAIEQEFGITTQPWQERLENIIPHIIQLYEKR